jgi:hypothetical protein
LALRAFFWLSTICIVASTFGYLVIAFSVYKLYSAERDIEKLEVQQIKDERALRQPDPPFRDMGPGENFEEFQRRNEADLRAHDRQQNEYFRERDTSRKKFREARTKLDDKIESYSIVLVLGLLLNGLAQIAAIPFILTCIYKMWAVIQDGRARTSPAKAAFCLLIPFYSLYWIFVAVHGWTGDANKYIARYKLDIEPVSPGLSLLACIAMLTRGIPGCGLLLEVFIVGIGLHWLFVATSTAADIAEERLAKEPARDGFVS